MCQKQNLTHPLFVESHLHKLTLIRFILKQRTAHLLYFAALQLHPLVLFKGCYTHQNFCLPNSLRVEKYLFTRKEIFTYTLKRNYLHVSNFSMCCFYKIKYWGKPCKGVIYHVPNSDKYNAKHEVYRAFLRFWLSPWWLLVGFYRFGECILMLVVQIKSSIFAV